MRSGAKLRRTLSRSAFLGFQIGVPWCKRVSTRIVRAECFGHLCSSTPPRPRIAAVCLLLHRGFVFRPDGPVQVRFSWVSDERGAVGHHKVQFDRARLLPIPSIGREHPVCSWKSRLNPPHDRENAEGRRVPRSSNPQPRYDAPAAATWKEESS